MFTLSAVNGLKVKHWYRKKFDSTECSEEKAISYPVVVAVVVNSALAVEKQAVLACFESQGPVGAEEELIADLGMRVGYKDKQ